MSKFLHKISAIGMSVFVCISFGLSVSAVEGSTPTEVSESDTLESQERKAIEDLAEHCGLETNELESVLSFKVSEKSKFFGKTCSLVPVCNCEEHLKCFLSVFSEARPEYMQYYANGELKSAKFVEAWFNRAVKNIGQDSPKSTTFLIKVGDNVVGRVGIGPLSDRGKENTEIGYAIEEAYSGEGVMSNAVASAISFLKLLREKGKECYDFTRLRATAKMANEASNRILLRNGFVKSESLANDGYGPKNEYFYYFVK